jgi:fibronectin-binding autotransporter adhesin
MILKIAALRGRSKLHLWTGGPLCVASFPTFAPCSLVLEIASPPQRVRLIVEALEDRTVPATFVWTGAVDGLFGTSGNWINGLNGNPTAAVPGAGDYAYFGGVYGGGAFAGTNADCTLDTATDFTVDRVIMNWDTGSYGGTLTVPAGTSLTASNYIDQAGTLAMTGGTLATSLRLYTYGTVLAGGTDASTITGLGSTDYPDVWFKGPVGVDDSAELDVTAYHIMTSDAVTVGAGSGGGTFSMTSCSSHQYPSSTITVNASSILSYHGILNATNTSWDMEGTLTMVGGGSGAATTIITDEGLMDAGTMNVLGTGNVISGIDGVGGNLCVVNGVFNVGLPPDPETESPNPGDFEVTDGSLTIGALSADLPGGAGTVNLQPDSELTVSSPTGAAFTIKGGTVNLLGHNVITSSVDLDIRGGTLDAADGTPGATLADTAVAADVNNGGTFKIARTVFVQGNLTNTGTIQYYGTYLQLLDVTGNYTQSSGGTLAMRLANGDNDVLEVGGTATVAGTLQLTGLETLAAGAWDIITAGPTSGGNFATIVWPDADAWVGAFAGGVYTVSK